MRLPGWVEEVPRNVRDSWRSLRRRPSFAIAAVVTVIVAVGLNGGLFTLVSDLFLRPWTVPNPSRVFLAARVPTTGIIYPQPLLRSEYVSLSQRLRSAELLAYDTTVMRLSPPASEDGQQVGVTFVSPNFFEVLELPLVRGSFSSVGDPSAIISHRAWRSLFAGDPAVVGRRIQIEAVRATVVGVAPAALDEFDGLAQGAFLPLAARHAWETGPASSNDTYVSVAGRLRAHVTLAQAQAEASVLDGAVGGDSSRSDRIRLFGTSGSQRPGGTKPGGIQGLALLGMACLLVLLLACVNLANLQLARNLARRHEIAIRVSLGASRTQIVRQLLTESLLVTASACGPAIGLACLLPTLAVSTQPAYLAASFRPDTPLILFSLGLCALTAAAFGLAPALHMARQPAGASMLRTGRTSTPGPGLWRSIALSVQIAVSLVLLVSATVLVRDLIRATSDVELGIRTDGVSVAILGFPNGATNATRRSVISSFVERLGSAGFEFAMAPGVPPRETFTGESFAEPSASGVTAQFSAFSASSDYFDVLGIPIVAGRTFSNDAARREVVINEALARARWPDGRAIGQTLSTADDGTFTVVGITPNARLTSLDRVVPIMVRARDNPSPVILLRARGENLPARLTALAKPLLPHLAVNVTSLRDSVFSVNSVRTAVVGAATASGLGLVALLLAMVGAFGVFWFVVEERLHEIGIRLALGARSSQILGHVLGAMRWSVGGGVAAGVAMAVVARRLLAGFLFGAGHSNVTSYLAAAAILATSALIATYLPARRAVRVDPVRTLRRD